jgi:hypothetical protein
MPEAMERKLQSIAHKKGYGKERTNAFVYGTMRKTGWTPSTQRSEMIRKIAKKQKGGQL